MAKLHILIPQGGIATGAHVFRGMYGTVEPVTPQAVRNGEDASAMAVNFTVDPALARSSNTMQALRAGLALTVTQNDIHTIEAPDDVVNALKATIAQGLLIQWERGYEQLGVRSDDNTDDVADSVDSARLVAIPGMGSISKSLLTQALQAERDVARRGIHQLIENLPGLDRKWVDVNLANLVVNSFDSNQLHTDYVSVSAAQELNLQPYSEELRNDNGTISQEASGARFVDGVARVPIYVPSAAARRFSFEWLLNRHRGQNGPVDEDSTMTAKAIAVIEAILGSKELTKMLILEPKLMQIDRSSLVPAQNPPVTHNYDYDYEEDFDDLDDEDSDDFARPRM